MQKLVLGKLGGVIHTPSYLKGGDLKDQVSLGKTLTTKKLGMVVHTCNPTNEEGISRSIMVLGQSGQKALAPI
jgi:hypothetical protein